jgi:hypothetical protein
MNLSEYMDSLEPSVGADWIALEEAIQEAMFFWEVDRVSAEAGVTDWLEMLIWLGAIS